MLNEGDRSTRRDFAGARERPVSPADFKGQKLVVYFYPRTTRRLHCRSKAFSALAGSSKMRTWILGVSKDDARKHRKFIDKYELKVPLASDADGSACEAFGTWVEKSMYGRKYMGIDRATFLIDRDGVVKRVWRKVKVPGHAEEVLAAARELP
jgi:peroxiredoxin Q/BCP